MPRKKTEVQPTFPPLTCGVCSYFAYEDTKHDISLCWLDEPKVMMNDDEGTPVFSRGNPVDPNWPKCRHFEPRMHG